MNKQQVLAEMIKRGCPACDAEYEYRKTAVHEAGHFVAAVIVGRVPQVFDLVPAEDSDGSRSLGQCGGVPHYPASEIEAYQIGILTEGQLQEYKKGTCLNVLHLLAAGEAVPAILNDYDETCNYVDEENAQAQAEKFFDDPEALIEEVGRIAGWLMKQKAVQAAVEDVAAWIAERVDPGYYEIEAKYFEVAKTVGKLRWKVYEKVDSIVQEGGDAQL